MKNTRKKEFDSVESPTLSDAMLNGMRPVAETHPEIPPRVRGPHKSPTKLSTTIRIDPEVLDFFKGQGNGWQNKINEVLKHYVETARSS